MLPPGHWGLKLKICRLFHANNMCKFDAEIKSYKDEKTIWIYHNHYLPCTYNSKRCRYVCNCYCYDRAVHISVAVDMRTLLDRKNFSSSSNGQVAAHWVTGLKGFDNTNQVVIITLTAFVHLSAYGIQGFSRLLKAFSRKNSRLF